MPGLSVVDALAILDSIAYQASNVKQMGFDQNLNYYSNNRQTILTGSSSADMSAAADLSTAFEFDVPVNISAGWEGRRAALVKHLGDLNAWCTANKVLLATELRDILKWSILPANIFYPDQLFFGSFILTGPGVCTFTDGEAADTAKYSGKNWVQLHCGPVTTTVALSVTVIGTKWDNSAQTKTVSVPIGTAPGFLVAVGTVGVDADSYKDVTNVTVTGGVAGDKFDVQSPPTRYISG